MNEDGECRKKFKESFNKTKKKGKPITLGMTTVKMDLTPGSYKSMNML
jgi:hypothetical protein